VIKAQGLIKRFGKLVAVDAVTVSFTCHDGEVFGLPRPNGGGDRRVFPRLRFLPNDANMSGRLVPGFPIYQSTSLPAQGGHAIERLKRFWNAFRDIAIIFSFVVNFVLVVLLIVLTLPALRTAFALKTGMVEPLLYDLDEAFVGLGEATIDTTVEIDESIPIQFDLPLDQSLPIDFQLPIEQPTVVVLTAPVPLNLPARFNLPGGGGVINGTVSLSLPTGMLMPIRLSMVVPVSQTVPVRMNVPVSETIPIQMAVPVHIGLGEAGLDPAVQELRAVFQPLREQIEALPDEMEFP
jgi:hypothetical protein